MTLGERISVADVAPELLERERELKQLSELIEAAAQGRGGAAVVLGPAGIGKTTLLRAACGLAAEHRVACLKAQGGELERDFAYGVVRQLFELPLRRLAVSERRSVLHGAAAFAAPVVGVQAPADIEERHSTFAMLHALYWLCVNMAERGPLLLVVDDLHWADAASLRFLAYLERRVGELPVLLLMAARPVVDAAQAELVDQVTSEPGVIRVCPAPLSDDAVADLLRASLGRTPAPAFVQACREATSGNPFLCATLACTVAEEGMQAEAGEADRIAELAARAVSAVVVRRLGRLSSQAAAVARAAAVLGTGAEPRHAAALAELGERDTAVAIDSLAAQDILHAGQALDFVHPLMRAAVREQIPTAERALLHSRAARLLASDGQPPEGIAMHLLAAQPSGNAWTVEALRAAAATVADRGDPGTAVSYLRRALREPPDAVTRAAVLRELGAAELHAGHPPAAAEHLREAHRLTEGAVQRAHIARNLSLALMTPGRYEAAVEVLEHAIDEVSGIDADLTLGLEAELHQCGLMQLSTYGTVKDRLGRLDREIEGATWGERAFLAALATEGCLRTVAAVRVRDWSARAFVRGLLADQTPYSALWANAAFPLIFAEGLTEAALVSTQAIEDARRRGSPIGSARAHTVSAMLHFRQGAVRDAEADARTAIEAGFHAGFLVSLLAVGVLVESLVERGEIEAAETELHETGMDAEVPELFLANWPLHARARLRIAQRRIREAVADLEELRRREAGWRPWNPGMFAYRSDLAFAVARSDRRRAKQLAQEELDLSNSWATPRAIGISLRTLGLIEGGQHGLELLHESVDTLAGSGARLEQARSLLELGAAIRRSGKRADAREPLHAAMEVAHRCGAAALSARAREELRATGARPRRIVRTGIDALTPSELRVARMAAQGMTNRDIAQALFVTLRTVQVHLTHTYQKLGISSRDDLVQALVS